MYRCCLFVCLFVVLKRLCSRTIYSFLHSFFQENSEQECGGGACLSPAGSLLLLLVAVSVFFGRCWKFTTILCTLQHNRLHGRYQEKDACHCLRIEEPVGVVGYAVSQRTVFSLAWPSVSTIRLRSWTCWSSSAPFMIILKLILLKLLIRIPCRFCENAVCLLMHALLLFYFVNFGIFVVVCQD